MWSMQIEMPALRRVLEAERAQAVGEENGLLVAVLAVADVDEAPRAPSCRASC